jgi:hypothetical protein
VQQTVDAVANVTKDQDVVVVLDLASETTLVSGLSYFFCSAAETAGAETVVDADATIAVSGSSSYSSSVADSVLAEAEMVADAVADATICAANLS